MAIRKDIVWTVGADGSVSPTAPQDGGVQGEHNATRVVFRVGENSVWDNPNYKLYIECDDPTGNHDTTDLLQVVGGQVSVPLPLAWTQYGGMVTLRLVAEEEDGAIAYTAEGVVRFDSRQNASKKVDGLLKGRLAEAEAKVKQAAEEARQAAASSAQRAANASTSAQGAGVHRQKAEEAAEAAKSAAEEAAESAKLAQYDKSYIGQASTAAVNAGRQATEGATAASASAESAYDSMLLAQKSASDAERAAASAGEAAKKVGGLPEKIANLRLVNARDYGAKGDGVTDDTAAIQAALYEAEASGWPLYIPAGNYLVSKTITTHTRDTDADKQSKLLNIYGSGMSTVFTTAPNFEGDFVFHIDPKGVQPCMVLVHDFAIDLTVDVSGIYFRALGMKSVIENLWINFEYLKKETDTTVRSAIFCENSVVSTFQRIKIMGNISGLAENLPKNCGIVLREQTTTKIIDCDIIFCGWAIYLGGGSILVIENNRIDENDYGVFQYTATSNIDSAPRAYTKSPVTGEDFGSCQRTITIAKNRFEANNCVSVFLVSYGTGSENYLCNMGVAITDNYFTGLGAGAAKWQPDRAVFRKAIRLQRCIGLTVERNTFNGKPYDSTNSESREQNYSGEVHVDDITFRDNVVTPCLTGEQNEDGTAAAVKGNTSLPSFFCTYKGFVNNIEANQTTRQDISVRRTMPINVTASGTVDVSKTNVCCLNDGVSVTAISIESGSDTSVVQEVTFMASGATATVKNTGSIRLADGADFVMGQFDTITLMRVYVYPLGWRWVEKSRSVNRAATVEEG